MNLRKLIKFIELTMYNSLKFWIWNHCQLTTVSIFGFGSVVNLQRSQFLNLEPLSTYNSLDFWIWLCCQLTTVSISGFGSVVNLQRSRFLDLKPLSTYNGLNFWIWNCCQLTTVSISALCYRRFAICGLLVKAIKLQWYPTILSLLHNLLHCYIRIVKTSIQSITAKLIK